jgi:WhiB family redox-sensing transcriptional regulator
VKEITFYVDIAISAETDWRQRAACRDSPDPDLFFPVGNTGPALEQIEAAKRICRICQVREECLDWALTTKQESGVWGGLSEDERRALREQQSQPVPV